MIDDIYLKRCFDCVLFFTWSDWDKELLSNRYYYATRFAKILPVFFFQHKYRENNNSLCFHESEINNLFICDTSVSSLKNKPDEIYNFLKDLGYESPLIWVYDHLNYKDRTFLNDAYTIYHATENYLYSSTGWEIQQEYIASSLIETINNKCFDQIVACVPSIKESIIENTNFDPDKIIIAPNGCDYKAIKSYISNLNHSKELNKKYEKIVCFQGTINTRLDYQLLYEIISGLPTFRFNFFGKLAETEENIDHWNKIVSLPNVSFFGDLNQRLLFKEISKADVAIIPYISDEWIKASLPLKSFEYLAVGIPVVTVPINYLESYSECFTTANSSSEFISSIKQQANRRTDEEFLKNAEEFSSIHDYDIAFKNVIKATLENYSIYKKFSLPLKNLFDCVLFFTSSDWDKDMHTDENHYAKRLAKIFPVYFFQHKYKLNKQKVSIKDSSFKNIRICDICINELRDNPDNVFSFLKELGYFKPIIWVNDHINYLKAIRYFPFSYVIYHSNENYLINSGKKNCISDISDTLRSLLSERIFDHIVVSSPAIKNSLLLNSSYRDSDITFASNMSEIVKISEKISFLNPSFSSDIEIVYKGKINSRIDFDLLYNVISNLPCYKFIFFGKIDESIKTEWDKIDKLPNVIYQGFLDISKIYLKLASANVGIIPFNTDKKIKESLPFKVFEYLASDLPVVSVPINYLSSFPEVFSIANTPNEFINQIQYQINKRFDEKFLEDARTFIDIHDKNKNFKYILKSIHGNLTRKAINISSLKNNLYKFLRKFRSVLRNSQPKFLLGRKRNFFYLFLAIPFFVLQIIRKAILIFLLKLKNILLIKVAPIIRKNRIIYLIIRKIYHPIKKIIARFLNY